MAKIIIVDDHKTMRTGLALLIRDIGHEVIGQASNGKEFLNLLDSQTPDIVLMDIQMPVMDGIDATREAMARFPDLKVLVLSMFTDEEYYNAFIDLGAKGFVLKESEHDEMQLAIKTILSGKLYFSQDLLVNLLRKKNVAKQVELNQRQMEVLQLMCTGMSSSEIAQKLLISARTIEKERSELLQVTGTTNSISLVVYAIKNGLVKI